MSGKNLYQQNLTARNDSGGNLNESKDEVDFVHSASYTPLKHTLSKDVHNNKNNNNKIPTLLVQRPILTSRKSSNCGNGGVNNVGGGGGGGTLYGDCEMKNTIKSSLSTLEKLSFFTLHKKPIKTNIINNNNNNINNINNNNNNNNSNNNLENDGENNKLSSWKSTTNQPNVKDHHHHRPRFVKSASIARLLGNTYNTKKFEKELRKFQENEKLNGNVGGCGYTNGNNHNPERFHKCSKEDDLNCNVNRINDAVNIADFHDDGRDLLGAKAFRTISRGLGKLWWKRTQSVEISTPDPEYKVSYLGNVLTGWAKGDGCVEKPLTTLWRNYTQTNKPDVIMRVRVCASGLKATTRQHGLTEYWANRITHCCAPKNFPRVICWIYRHEGRKLKHELRCHAVLCAKESIAQEICNTLRENLDRALFDFKREKILKQNARLSLANAVYDNPSLPRRKILLSVGGNNYRPPLERSKSAPKLMAIEEAIGEEDGEDIEETNEPEMPSCCQRDSLYPAMTLGRRRCRRGHSIRRTGKACQKQNIFNAFNSNTGDCCKPKDSQLSNTNNIPISADNISTPEIISRNLNMDEINETENEDDNQRTIITKSISSQCSNSDDDDLDKLLSYHDYDTNSPLAGELMTYFDMKLHKKTSSLINLNENENDDEESFASSINTDPSPKLRPALSLDILDNCSEDDVGSGHCGDADGDDEDDDTDELFFRQTAILNLLHRNSLRKMANLSMSSDDSNSLEPTRNGRPGNLLDSDEGSISSGCETASTVTTNSINQQAQNKPQPQICRQLEHSNQQESDLSPIDDDGKIVTYSKGSIKLSRGSTLNRSNGNVRVIVRKQSEKCVDDNDDESDSEFSDESGYVEYQQDKNRQTTTQNKTTTAV